MRVSSRRIGEFLVEHRVLTRDTLEELLAREAREGTGLIDLLARHGMVSERDLTAAIAFDFGVPFVDLTEQPVAREVWGLVPEDLARRHRAVAVSRTDASVLVAFGDPADAEAISAVSERLASRVDPAAAAATDLDRAISQMYGGDPAARGDTGQVPQLDDFLRHVLSLGGSDLHLTVGVPPMIRTRGELKRLPGAPVLNGSDVRRLLFAVLTQRQRERLLADGELQTAHAMAGAGRFRVNAFVQRSSLGVVLRLVPDKVPTPEELGLPSEGAALADLPTGLVLVCGSAGSGTSTTVASFVDRINRTRLAHVLTLEDPIEFLHRHQQSVVNQREVGEDTAGFSVGLRNALRQDVDVIVLGDLPDRETIELALSAAETGHLVIAAVRAVDTAQAVERIIEIFPAEQQPQVRYQLGGSLRGVIAQRLVPRVDGGMALAAELLFPTQTIVRLLRGGDLSALRTAIVSGGGSGMVVLDQALAALVQDGVVSADAAIEHAVDPEELRYLLSGRAGS